MRVLILMLAIGLSACSHDKKLKSCLDEHWWSCTYYDSEEEYLNGVRLERERLLNIIEREGLNFSQCSALLLIDQIKTQEIDREEKIYISAGGVDPKPEVFELLSRNGIHAIPESSYIKPKDHPFVVEGWHFNAGVPLKIWLGGYKAYSGYYCGPLCAGNTEYKIEKDEGKCKITSRSHIFSA